MGKQQHDIGARKRRTNTTNGTTSDAAESPDQLARDLVDRGLASRRILA